MPVINCRICGNQFYDEPLLLFRNMPGRAQFLPDAGSLSEDCGVDLEVLQCSGCGLVQLKNEPVHYFRDVIRAAAVSGEMEEFRKKQFGEFIKNYSLSGKKLIEIGCGRGEFLSILGQFEVEAYGLEHFGDSVARCASDGLKVSCGFIQNSAQMLPNAPFDAFFLLNFLEHIPDPNSMLRGIYNNLADDAVGLVEVPNFNMILRKNLFSEFMLDHLLYFTSDTLASALRINGFEVLDLGEKWRDYILSAVVRKKKPTDLSAFSGARARLHSDLEAYIRQFGAGNVAIWGAGHQAFALMALMGLAEKIKFVVDSAPFKQGRFTPVTHIPIVSPDVLDLDPADAIIVMAASYSDEVAGIIRKKFGSKIKVAIIRDFGLEIA